MKLPSLDALARKYGGWRKIPAASWKEYDRRYRSWKLAMCMGLNYLPPSPQPEELMMSNDNDHVHVPPWEERELKDRDDVVGRLWDLAEHALQDSQGDIGEAARILLDRADESERHELAHSYVRKRGLAIRKAAGRKIDPATAEVTWTYGQTMDPYGIDPSLPDELQQIGREYFARAPESDIWVHFSDLPKETRKELLSWHEDELMFPAGLEQALENTSGKS